MTNPEALKQLHIEFRAAGAEVLQGLTFYATATNFDNVQHSLLLRESGAAGRMKRYFSFLSISTAIESSRIRAQCDVMRCIRV
jgi:hypothetical protein